MVRTIAAPAAAPPPSFGGARGAVCFTWDDGWASHLTVARMAASRGQRHTFFVTSSHVGSNASWVTTANLGEMSSLGHEIGAHGREHTNLTTLGTPALRAAQYDDAKAALEGMVGVGNVTSYAYPNGGRNATTDQELFLRHDRVFGIGDPTGFGQAPSLHHASNRDGLLFGRMEWTEAPAKNARLAAMIRLCAVQPYVLVVYGHALDAVDSPTTAQVAAAMDLCQALGVPCVTTREAFPAGSALIDAGFEEPGVYGADTPWAAVGAGGAESVVDAPMAGLSGTRSLRLRATDAASTRWVGQRVPIRSPGVSWTVSFRYRLAVTSGAGEAYVLLLHGLFDGPAPAQTRSAALTATTWTRFTMATTLNANARMLAVEFHLDNLAADLFVDHVHLAPTAAGSFG